MNKNQNKENHPDNDGKFIEKDEQMFDLF